MPRKPANVAGEPSDNQEQPINNNPIIPSPNISITSSTTSSVYTDWGQFAKAGLRINRVTCQGYAPVHLYDQGCHTRLPVDPVVMKSHLDRDHGGGFEVVLGPTESEWSGWKKFGELGLELQDLQCAVCYESIRPTFQHILRHMKPHTNANRRMEVGGRFYMTIGYARPIDD